MPYIIDGHNLIPKVPGLTLRAIDDEMQLVELLNEFSRQRRKQVEVYFDNAPPGGVKAHNFGLVIARFVRQGVTADDAIRAKLQRLGRSARNWTVVSSDLAVQADARAAQARIMTSEAFASLLAQELDNYEKDFGESEEIALESGELDEWLEIFGEDQEN